MDGQTLQDTAQHCAENLPATTLYEFEPGWITASVHGRWFLLLTDVPPHSRARDAHILAGKPVVIVKSDPDDAAALREAHADIITGYHMNKRHWITMAPGDSIDEQLVEELVTESYRLVTRTLPPAPRRDTSPSDVLRAAIRRALG